MRNVNNSPNTQQHNSRRAVVIVAVLVVVVILALLSYQYLDLMMAEYNTAENVRRTAQARMLAESGVNYASVMLSNPSAVETLLSGNTYNNPDAFHGQIVLANDAPNQQGRFSIIAPAQDGGQGGVRFGVVDESAKINLNAIMKLDKKGETLYEMLSKLPLMDASLAAAIVDWLDEDAEPREGGAEDESYSGLEPPYRCKNGPLESLDELLLVQGMTPQLLFGNDTNRNGMIDGDETSTDPITDLGLSNYLTIYSRELNITNDNKIRVDVNEKDLTVLHDKLTKTVGSELAAYVVLYRQNGGTQITPPSSTDSSSKSDSGSGSSSSNNSNNNSNNSSGNSSSNTAPTTGESVSGVTLDLNKEGKKKIKSLFDLIYSTVTVKGKSNKDPSVTYISPLLEQTGQEQLLPLLFEKTSTLKDTDIPARININTAPDDVIMALPKLTEEEALMLVAMRPSVAEIQTAGAIFKTPAWMMAEAGFSIETVRELEKYVTTRSQVYRVQVLGYFDQGGPYSRLEAVFDTNAGRPRILFMRDLTSLGRGFNLTNGQ